MTRRPRDAWELWLLHHAAATCYRLEATTAERSDRPETAAFLRWEADRHTQLATKHKARVQPRKDAA